MRPPTVGLDGSRSSAAVLHEAAELAGSLGAGLRMVTCWQVPQIYTPGVELQDSAFRDDAQAA